VKTIEYILNHLFVFYKKHPFRIAFIQIIGLLSALLASVNIVMLIPILEKLDNKGGNSFNMKFLPAKINHLFEWVMGANFFYLVLILLILLVVQKGIQYISQVQNEWIEIEFYHELKKVYYERVFESSWKFFVTIGKERIYQLVLFQIRSFSTITHYYTDLGASLLFLIIQLIIVLYIAPWVTLIVIAYAFIYLFIIKPGLRKINEYVYQAQELDRNYIFQIKEFLASIKEIKSYRLEDKAKRSLEEVDASYKRNHLSVVAIEGKVDFITKLVSIFSGAILIYVLYQFFSMNLAEIIVLFYIYMRSYGVVESLYGYYSNLIQLVPSIAYLKEFPFDNQEIEDEKVVWDFSKGIECVDLSFSYHAKVLEDVNTLFEPGKMTVIAGENGAGKSTLLNVILGFLPAEKGYVKVGENCVTRENLSSFLEHIAYISQESMLMNMTLFENIAWFIPTVTKREVLEAYEMIGESAFIEGLHSGVDTQVGENGQLLSGGERQKLAIVRAIVKKSDVVVLDEATSALDFESENQVREILKKLKVTAIVIAHRLETILASDRCIILEKGRKLFDGKVDSELVMKFFMRESI